MFFFEKKVTPKVGAVVSNILKTNDMGWLANRLGRQKRPLKARFGTEPEWKALRQPSLLSRLASVALPWELQKKNQNFWDYSCLEENHAIRPGMFAAS